jgi:hypothetical protein
MQATTRLDAAFTATLAAALLALGVTAFSSIEGGPAAEPAVHVTLPAVTIVAKRAALEAELARPLTAAPAGPAVQSDGSVASSAS